MYFTFIIASTVHNKPVVSRDHTPTALSFRGRVLFFISVHGFVNPSYLQGQGSYSTIALPQFQYSTVKAGGAGPSSLWSKQKGLLAHSLNVTCITAAAVSKISNLKLGLRNAEDCLNFELTTAYSFGADEACTVSPVISTLTSASLSLT